MKVKVLAFARYSELVGFTEAELLLPEPPTLCELLKHPCFMRLPSDALFAVNKKYVGSKEVLHSGDEVAIMPPVSGG